MNTCYPGAALALFARVPRPGQVKTRLVPVLGEEGATDLHCLLLARQLDWLRETALCEVSIWTDTDAGHPLLSPFEGCRHLQKGRDLGARMWHCAHTMLKGREMMVLFGSDCPAIDENYVGQALKALADGAEAVLGPARDGGYVLIGLRRVDKAWFRDIDWGSDRVLAQTLQKLEAAGISATRLPTLDDIDRPEDLALLPAFELYPRISRRLV